MDPLPILSAIGTAIGITKNVAETLNTLLPRYKIRIDHFGNCTGRWGREFEGILQRIWTTNFSDPPMRAVANMGAHWNAVLQASDLKMQRAACLWSSWSDWLAGHSSVISSQDHQGLEGSTSRRAISSSTKARSKPTRKTSPLVWVWS